LKEYDDYYSTQRFLPSQILGIDRGVYKAEADCVRFAPEENFTTTKEDIPKFVFKV